MKTCHQCLSAVSPLGTVTRSRAIGALIMESPMPFGSESAWDAGNKSTTLKKWASHQCLSAVSPLGTIYVPTAVWTGEKKSPMPFGSESAWDP